MLLLCLLSSMPQVFCPKKGEHLFPLGWKQGSPAMHDAQLPASEKKPFAFSPHPKPDLEEEAGGCDKVARHHNLLIPFFVCSSYLFFVVVVVF